MRQRFHPTAKDVKVGDGFRTEDAKEIVGLGRNIARAVGIQRRRRHKEHRPGTDKGLESLVDRGISSRHG